MNMLKQSNMQSENGSTFIGNLIVVAAIMLLGLVGMKVFSAYSEFYSVKSVLKSMNQEPLDTMGKHDIENAFDRRATTSYITTISGKDLKVDKQSGTTVVSVNYQVVKPIAANVSVLVDFAASNLDK
jgi:hypothetical protein